MEQKSKLVVRFLISLSLLFTASLACNLPDSSTGSLLAVAVRLTGSPTLTVYVGNPQENPFQLPAGEYYIEAMDADGIVYEGWREAVEQMTDDGDVIPLSQRIRSKKKTNEEAALQLQTLAGFIASVDLAQLTYLEIASRGFQESFQTAAAQIEMGDIDPFYARLKEIEDQEEAVFAAITALESRAQLTIGNSQQTQNRVLASKVLPRPYLGIVDVWNSVKNFFTFKDDEDKLAQQEILAVSAAMTPGEKEEAFFWLETDKIGGAQTYDEFLALLQNGELENVTSIRSDLYTGGPYQGVYQIINPNSNHPGGETIHRVGGELITRGAELEWTLTKETLAAAFPEMVQGFGYADQANQWLNFVQNMYINPLGAIKDLGIDKIKSEIQENIKWDLLHAMPNLSEETAGQMAEHLTNEIVETHVDLASAIGSAQDSEVECTGVGVGQYELAAQQLGLAPEQATNPETASYVVCTDKATGQPVSIQLVEDEIETDEETPIAPDEQTTSIIYPGTYEGDTTIHELYDFPDKPGEITENRITIIVGEDGVVSGVLSVIRTGIPSEHGLQGDCTLTYNFSSKGTISGLLTETSGQLSIDFIHINALDAQGDCNIDSYMDENEGPLTASVSINGNTITGTVPDLFSFTVTKTTP